MQACSAGSGLAAAVIRGLRENRGRPFALLCCGRTAATGNDPLLCLLTAALRNSEACCLRFKVNFPLAGLRLLRPNSEADLRWFSVRFCADRT